MSHYFYKKINFLDKEFIVFRHDYGKMYSLLVFLPEHYNAFYELWESEDFRNMFLTRAHHCSAIVNVTEKSDGELKIKCNKCRFSDNMRIKLIKELL